MKQTCPICECECIVKVINKNSHTKYREWIIECVSCSYISPIGNTKEEVIRRHNEVKVCS